VSNGQAGLPAGLRQIYLGNLDPRISVAYRPFQDNKTVVRAGFGIFTVTNLRLRFEATFTNVLNHPNFAPPATNVSNPSTFGVLQSAQTAENGGNRTGQVALRLDF
jgi:hypothetical protein